MALENLKKRYEQLQGLLNTPMSQTQGGLLGNIPKGTILGASLIGQGIQGKDPFSALLPAAMQTAQLQKYLTPKESFRQLTDAEKQLRGLPIDKQFQIGANNKIMQIGGSGTNVTVNTPPPETSEEKELGKIFGEEFRDINKAGNLANINDQKLDILMTLNES